jgi:hypothetical protein
MSMQLRALLWGLLTGSALITVAGFLASFVLSKIG